MTLTVADIERWDAGDVREVFHAAHSRAQAAFDAADGLATLPALTSFGGVAGQAAKDAINTTRKDLDAHGNEALAVATAAGHAADSIDGIKSDLAQLKADAEVSGLQIDPESNHIVPVAGSTHGRREMQAAIPGLQARLAALVDQANATDAALANAINMADGAAPVPASPHENRPEIQAALDDPLPQDPKKFDDLWDKLTPEEKDWLYSRDHSLGNRDGMAATDRDHYNRLTLADELGRAQAAEAQYNALKNQQPDIHDQPDFQAWQSKITAAAGLAKNLPDLQAVDKTVSASPDRKLMVLDTQTGRQPRAAVAVGDPDTANHVSVTTPGLNTTVHGSISSMTEEATNLRVEALRQLGITPGHEGDTVATIAWIGYDPPQIPGWDDISASAAGGWEVSHDDVAKAGAVDLSRFYDGLGASHQGAPAQLTAIGHSYGSLTTGLALQQPGSHGVSDAIFYGSPGIEASTPQQLQLQSGHVYAMETPDDPIQWTYDSKPIIHNLPFIGPFLSDAAELSDTGAFGPNPATNENFTQLATGPTAVSDGHGGSLNLDGAHGHSDYPRQGGNGLPRTTGYNIAAVIAGLGSTDAIPEQ